MLCVIKALYLQKFFNKFNHNWSCQYGYTDEKYY